VIREIGKELEARLVTFGVPIKVFNAPELPATLGIRERIVIGYDVEGTDSYGPPRSQSVNPKRRHLRLAACKLTVYVQSVVAGANVFEHQRRAYKLVDQVITALDYVAAVRKNLWAPGQGRWVVPPDLAASEKPLGAVYELKFNFEQPVSMRTWADAIRPEKTLASGGMASTTRVSQSGAADDDEDPNNVPGSAELACGEE
jgi:hypothetical protein